MVITIEVIAGDRIFVEDFNFKGWATVEHIFPSEIFSIQIKLDEGDQDGHKMKRVSMYEVKRKQEQNKSVYIDPDKEYLAEIRIKYKGYSFATGQKLIVKSTRSNSSAHFYMYDIEDKRFRGCMPRDIFIVLGEYSGINTITMENRTVSIKEKPVEVKQKHNKINREQMNIFDFLEAN